MSSPSLRCLQTVAPLAAARGLVVEQDEALAEGGGPQAARLLRALGDADVVLCSHGDVIPEVLESLDRNDVDLERRRCQKGSTWVLQSDDAKLVAARYLPPPG